MWNLLPCFTALLLEKMWLVFIQSLFWKYRQAQLSRQALLVMGVLLHRTIDVTECRMFVLDLRLISFIRREDNVVFLQNWFTQSSKAVLSFLSFSINQLDARWSQNILFTSLIPNSREVLQSILDNIFWKHSMLNYWKRETPSKGPFWVIVVINHTI